jgi:hypothetical protein
MAKTHDPSWMDRSRTLLSRLPIKSRETHAMTPFHFFPSQEMRFQRMREQWRREGHVRIIDLKSRRVGFSSQTDGFFWTRAMGFSNQNIKIVAHLATSAEELFRVPSDLSKAYPEFPMEDIQQKRIYFRHLGGDSHVSVATAGTPSAGRGGTLSALHLSEAAKYYDPEIFTAMISSVAKGPGSMIVIESTANGREGPGEAFFEYWNDAVAGKNGYIANFAGWLEDPAFIRPEEEAEDAPRDDLEKELMAKPYNATREQIAWMRRTKAEDCLNIETRFLTDFPHCPEVAFQISGDPALPREELAYARSTVHPPLGRGKFYRAGPGRIEFHLDDNGPVFLWRYPYNETKKPDGMHYFVGADAALGTEEGDFTAYCCLCGETGELACRFAERVPPEILADQLDMCGHFYNRAMVNIELTGNLGRWALKVLRDTYRYPNIYTWRGRDDRKRGKSRSIALGFEMNQATRRLIIDAMRSGIRMGMNFQPGGLVINDAALMNQIDGLTIKEWRWEIRRDHDDICVAYAIACLTREQYPPARMKFAPKNTMVPQNPREVLEMPIREEIGPMIQREMRSFMKIAKTRVRDRLVGI